MVYKTTALALKCTQYDRTLHQSRLEPTSIGGIQAHVPAP